MYRRAGPGLVPGLGRGGAGAAGPRQRTGRRRAGLARAGTLVAQRDPAEVREAGRGHAVKFRLGVKRVRVTLTPGETPRGPGAVRGWGRVRGDGPPLGVVTLVPPCVRRRHRSSSGCPSRGWEPGSPQRFSPASPGEPHCGRSSRKATELLTPCRCKVPGGGGR